MSEKKAAADNKYIEGYIERSRKAQETFEKLTQEETDRAVMVAARTVFDNAEELAAMAVEESGMGNYEDKVAKNKGKARVIWNSLKNRKSKGIIETNEITGIIKIAKPVGVVAAITPCTNPIVTPMSNIMFALKGGNSIIITPNHRAVGCSTRTVELINKKLATLGMPEDLVQIIDQQSRENTRDLITAADVVIATGGMGMVKAAYSSGKPALGVGAGNVQCIIDENVNFEEAIPKIVAGRIFDNGIICSGEQSVIAPEKHMYEIINEFKNNGAYVVKNKKEKEALLEAMFIDGNMNKQIAGKSVQIVAKMANIQLSEEIKLMVIEVDDSEEEKMFAKEKMCPVLSLYKYKNFKEGVETAKRNLDYEGKGHSVCIHSNSRENIEYAGQALSVSRIVVNQVSATGAGGSFFNGLAPTNTLGCGSWGNNSISENLTYKHLINISRIAYHMEGNSVPTEKELWTI